jgi:hypothetical protein
LGSGVAREAPAQNEPRSAKLLRPREPEKRRKSAKTEPSQQGFQDKRQTQSENTRRQAHSENARRQAHSENARRQAHSENARRQAQSENARRRGSRTQRKAWANFSEVFYKMQNAGVSEHSKSLSQLFCQITSHERLLPFYAWKNIFRDLRSNLFLLHIRA